jgi:peptide/nickel transport system permease protein
MGETLVEAERVTGEAVPTVAVRSEWGLAWRRLRRNKAAMAGAAILILLALVAIFADLLPLAPINELDYPNRLKPPGFEGHLFGTDDLGRDVFSRVLHGTRISLRIGFLAVSIASIAGSLVGLAAGYFGGWVDMLISRVLDVMLAFPGLLAAIVIIAAIGPGLDNALIALGIAGIPGYARVVRGTTLAAKELVYIKAARAVGMSDIRIMLKQILPNTLSPLLVMVSLGIGGTMLNAAGLSFLGLGAAEPVPEWGLELNIGRALLREAPWLVGFNALALGSTVLSINMLGDGLREALDPQGLT